VALRNREARRARFGRAWPDRAGGHDEARCARATRSTGGDGRARCTWLEALDEALDELPEGQRAALELRIVDDLSYEAVGDALGTSPRAARVRVHRGLRTLRSMLTNGTEATR